MKFIQTRIPDVVIIEPDVFEDDRGWFMESFNEQSFHAGLTELDLPIPRPFVQDNHSCSKKNVLRGLHYQAFPYAQGKLVRVTQGAVYDVAVDIRQDSPTLGQWVGVELSADNQRILWIPEGFAHGFLAVQEDTLFSYKTTSVYNKGAERSIKWDDPDIGINWPLTERPRVSEKDDNAPFLKALQRSPYPLLKDASRVVSLRSIGDDRGRLVAIEQGEAVPFNIRRAYYIYDTKSDVARGFHAHRCLQQLAVCVSGKCRMILDDGRSREEFWLDSPEKALLIENMIWREMHDFSEDCVLLVFASEHYDESDYIREYERFIKEINDAEK